MVPRTINMSPVSVVFATPRQHYYDPDGLTVWDIQITYDTMLDGYHAICQVIGDLITAQEPVPDSCGQRRDYQTGPGQGSREQNMFLQMSVRW